jgi:hypothetical protein
MVSVIASGKRADNSPAPPGIYVAKDDAVECLFMARLLPLEFRY